MTIDLDRAPTPTPWPSKIARGAAWAIAGIGVLAFIAAILGALWPLAPEAGVSETPPLIETDGHGWGHTIETRPGAVVLVVQPYGPDDPATCWLRVGDDIVTAESQGRRPAVCLWAEGKRAGT